MQTTNPFQPIMDGLEELKEHHSIKRTELELKKKFYSFKEASEILKLDYQTVRSSRPQRKYQSRKNRQILSYQSFGFNECFK